MIEIKQDMVFEQATSDQLQHEPITAFMQEFGLDTGVIDFSAFDDRNQSSANSNGSRELRPPRWYGWTLLQVMFVGQEVNEGTFEEQRARLQHQITALDERQIVERFRDYGKKLAVVRDVPKTSRNFRLNTNNLVIEDLKSRGLPPVNYRAKWFDMNMVGALDTMLNGPKNEVDRASWQRKHTLTSRLSQLAGETVKLTARAIATILQIGDRVEGLYIELGEHGQKNGKCLGRTIETVYCLRRSNRVDVTISAPSGQITREVTEYEFVLAPTFQEHCSDCPAARVCARRDRDALALEFAGRLKDVFDQ